MPLSLQEISLNKAQIKMLKKLFNGKRITRAELSNEKYSSLEYYGLIAVSNGNYLITEKGKSYLRLTKKESFRFWFPVAISVAALIISIIALVR